MEAIQTYKQYKTECAESLKGNFLFTYVGELIYKQDRHKNSSQKFVTQIRHKNSSQKFVTKIRHKKIRHKNLSQKYPKYL